MTEIFKSMLCNGGIKSELEVKMMSPLVLAYVGDAIYEVFVRSYLVSQKNVSVNELHKAATTYVKAKSQAEIVHALEEEFTEDEWSVIKKGRNQKSSTVPKNAVLMDYKYATGFEALIGYLFYTGKLDRLCDVFNKSVQIINESKLSE